MTGLLAAAGPGTAAAGARATSAPQARSAASGGAGLGEGPSAPTPGALSAATPGAAGVTGTTPSDPAHPTVPGLTAEIIGGLAYAPADAPLAVKRAIWAGDRIRHKPYIFGGGHGSFRAAGYDCSGSVSYVLHAAGLLARPMDSTDFFGWGTAGTGAWITVYTNSGHAFVEIAGIRLDTSDEGDLTATSGSGPRWRPLLADTSAYRARHPSGF